MKLFVRALLCALCFVAPMYGQMTQVTASSLRIGSSIIGTGTVCAVAVDQNNNPVTVTIGSGAGMQGVGQSCGAISAGAITGAVGGGTFQVPDINLALNPGFFYAFTITDTGVGDPKFNQSFQLSKVSGVTGSTWALDHYIPVTSVFTAPVFTFSAGVGAPTISCSGKSFYQDNTTSTAPVLYSCGTDSNFHMITGSGGGGTGPTGATGPAGTAASVSVGTVTPLSAGTTPTITNAGSSSSAVLNFGIPAGATGATGPTGPTGATGSAASVTATNMATAVAGQTGCGTTGAAWNPATNTCVAGGSGGASTPATINLLKGNNTTNGVIAAVPGTDYVTPLPGGNQFVVQSANSNMNVNFLNNRIYVDGFLQFSATNPCTLLSGTFYTPNNCAFQTALSRSNTIGNSVTLVYGAGIYLNCDQMVQPSTGFEHINMEGAGPNVTYISQQCPLAFQAIVNTTTTTPFTVTMTQGQTSQTVNAYLPGTGSTPVTLPRTVAIVAGQHVTINGVYVTVAAVTDATHFTLSSTDAALVGAQTGVNMTSEAPMFNKTGGNAFGNLSSIAFVANDQAQILDWANQDGGFVTNVNGSMAIPGSHHVAQFGGPRTSPNQFTQDTVQIGNVFGGHASTGQTFASMSQTYTAGALTSLSCTNTGSPNTCGSYTLASSPYLTFTFTDPHNFCTQLPAATGQLVGAQFTGTVTGSPVFSGTGLTLEQVITVTGGTTPTAGNFVLVNQTGSVWANQLTFATKVISVSGSAVTIGLSGFLNSKILPAGTYTFYSGASSTIVDNSSIVITNAGNCPGGSPDVSANQVDSGIGSDNYISDSTLIGPDNTSMAVGMTIRLGDDKIIGAHPTQDNIGIQITGGAGTYLGTECDTNQLCIQSGATNAVSIFGTNVFYAGGANGLPGSAAYQITNTSAKLSITGSAALQGGNTQTDYSMMLDNNGHVAAPCSSAWLLLGTVSVLGNDPQFGGADCEANLFSIAKPLGEAIGSAITAASTIAPTSPVQHIVGTSTIINTITAPASCTTATIACKMTFLVDTAQTFGTTGNIVNGGGVNAGNQVTMTYDASATNCTTGAGCWSGIGPITATVLRTASGFCTGTFTASAGITIPGLGTGLNTIACTSTHGALSGFLLNGSGTLSNLKMRCGTTGVSPSDGVLTLSVTHVTGSSFSATPLTLTYGDATVHVNNTLASDTNPAHNFTYSDGDIATVNITTQAATTLANCSVSFNY